MTVRDTSIRTYREIITEGVVCEKQAEVINFLLRGDDLTDYEIAAGMNHLDPNSVRPRRRELVKLGIVSENGKKKCMVTGRTAYKWILSDDVNKEEILRRKDETSAAWKECPMCQGEGKVRVGQSKIDSMCER